MKSPLQRIQLEQSPNPETEHKIQSLLSQMTLEEKVGQMTQITHSVLLEEVILNEDGSPGDDFSLDPQKVRDFIENYHIGSFLNGIGVSAEEWIAYSQKIQEINLSINRHGIPIIYGIDHMHGASYVDNSTIFPHRTNLGATFNPYFSTEEGRITGIESAELGHHWEFAPVLDVGRNPAFPRFYETYSEDPLLCARMGEAFIKAVQHNPATAPYKQAACAKHFIGYSDPKSGWDRSPGEISDQRLYEYFVPPFRAAIEAGVMTFMINGGEINGVPVHASYRLLTRLLRDELGFKGVVVTDWEDVIRLHTVHKMAKDEKEAAFIALNAGIDMSMTPFTTNFHTDVCELVHEGRLSEDRIDLSVARILRLKLEIGLFDNPYPSAANINRIKCDEHVAIARQAAEESMVLMKNEGVLPLEPNSVHKLLVCGPNANNKRSLSGGWTLRWIPREEELYPEEMDTMYTALKKEFAGADVSLIEVQDLESEAANADAIIVVAGELPYSEGSGNIYDMTLPSVQLELIKQAQQTAKSVVLVMVAGRPRNITEIYDGCAGVIWAGLPGFEGAGAIARVISGAVNPSGKLPFSYPAYNGHFYPYDYKLMDLGHYQNFAETKVHLTPFGHGLSYTNFEYSDLTLNKNKIGRDELLTAIVSVKNTGQRAVKETVIWYIHDEIASITRPLKQMKHFEKRLIGVGETGSFSFEIHPERDLSFPNEKGEMLLEAGSFVLKVGGLSTTFELE